ncbi:hypothetical protein J7E62_02750 [Variovorax paradoxus]|nr:hypothetical protein [Variovorax paradoxus]
MDHLYLTGIILLATLAVAATLHPAFDDTFTQRAGLGLVAVGGAADATSLLAGAGGSHNAHLLLVLGCAVYGVGTGLKTWHYRKKA